jgi:hypothetical protein
MYVGQNKISARKLMKRKILTEFAPVLVLILLVVSHPGYSKTANSNSSLPAAVRSQLEKSGKYLRAGDAARATALISGVLQASESVSECLDIAAYTEAYGFPALEARRQCLSKALSLCKTPEEFTQVVVKSRQYQMFEITRGAITSLVSTADTPEELYRLALQARESALNDVTHAALEKMYGGISTVPEALRFAADAKSMGMDDLAYKAAKDVVDDENNAHQLCLLLKSIEPLNRSDLNRYCLKKALDKALTVGEFAEIYEAARRNREADIFKVAEYRGRKLQLLNKVKQEQEDFQKQLPATQENKAGQSNAAPAEDVLPGGF